MAREPRAEDLQLLAVARAIEALPNASRSQTYAAAASLRRWLAGQDRPSTAAERTLAFAWIAAEYAAEAAAAAADQPPEPGP
jgi:hypothetical protein